MTNSMSKGLKIKKSILMVDDEETILTSFKRFLVKEGYDVTTALSGKEALKILNADKTFDLIILDILMPDMTGIDVAKAIRKNPKTASSKIIFLSVVDLAKDMIDSIKPVNVVKYIRKPVDINVLREQIEIALKK